MEPDGQAEDEEEESKRLSKKPTRKALQLLQKRTCITLALRIDETTLKQSGYPRTENIESARGLET